MFSLTALKAIGIVASVLGAGASVVGGLVGDKKSKIEMQDEVKKQVAEAMSEINK